MSNHCPLMLWHSSSYLRTQISITLIYKGNSNYQMTTNMKIFRNGKFFLYPCLHRVVIQWNNAIYRMNYWVCTAGRYRATSILRRGHAAFFNNHQIEAMIYMPDEIILARMMTSLDLEFEKAMHYYNEGYKSDNEYGFLPQAMRPVCIYSVFTTMASLT